jgi:exonuclease VII large subunit
MQNTEVRVLIFSCILSFFCLSVHAQGGQATTPGAGASATPTEQAPVAPRPISGTLSRQFSEMKDRANSYEDYKVIKQHQLDGFWRNVQDSLQKDRKAIAAAQQEIDEQKAELSQLKQALQTKEQSIQKSSYDNERISVLGLQVLKDTYVYTNWAIIFGLLVVVGVAWFKYKSSNRIASDARKEHNEIKKELEIYKQRLLDNKQQLGRELQTERNRVEELNQQIATLQKQIHMNSGTNNFRHM